jgi:carbonic anhydrase
LAVLGVFFESAESPNDPKYVNKFIPYLEQLPEEGSTTVIDKCDFKTILDLIKYDVEDFYSYKGSLTTPPLVLNF